MEAESLKLAREEIQSVVEAVLDKWHDGLRERKAREIATAILAAWNTRSSSGENGSAR